jgi:hypothetical protein
MGSQIVFSNDAILLLVLLLLTSLLRQPFGVQLVSAGAATPYLSARAALMSSSRIA